MTQVVTFIDYVPAARYDDIPWATADIYEAPAATGPWTLIDSVVLDPVDADPSAPASRSFTTALGTGPDLYYRVTFVDAGSDVSASTAAVQNTDPITLTPSTNYLTVTELKATLALTGQVFADDDLELAISAASDAVNEACSRRFYPIADTRYFTPPYWPGTTGCIKTGDLVSVTALTVDNDGDGTYETTWTEGTHFTLEPFQNDYVNKPFDRIQLFGYPYSLYRFPFSPRSVKVEGTFGWATTPPQVKAFTSIIAAKLVARMREREARLGFASVGADDAPSAIRLARTDPDFEFYLEAFVNTGPLIS